MKNFDITDLFRLGGFHPLAFNDLNDEEDAAYLKGASLASPIKLETSNGLKRDVFNNSSYEDFNSINGIIDGQLSDPISGKTISFTNAKSFAQAQGLLEEIREAELEKKLHDKVIASQMIMISSAGGPEQTESQYKNAIQSLKGFAKLVGKATGLDPNALMGDYNQPLSNKGSYEALLNTVDSMIASFDDRKKDAVTDAVRANTSFMSLAELREFASRFPGLNSIIKNRLALIKKSGLSAQGAEMKTGTELSDIVSDHKRKTIVHNLRERSDGLDFGVVKLSPESIQDKALLRDKADWHPTIDIA